MNVIEARNVNDAFEYGKFMLRTQGVARASRGGSTVEMDWPVTTTYSNPTERVLFCSKRNANPFFHFFEAHWMLAGHNDVAPLKFYNNRISDYSDDGVTLRGSAYGYRWRHYFGYDQLAEVIKLLRTDPNTRRAVISMWDPGTDLITQESKDLPCNQQVIFRLRPRQSWLDDSGGLAGMRLDMLVTNRSNDIIWGLYGANYTQFTFLHEYVARALGVVVGKYTHVSNSYHAYTEVFERQAFPDDYVSRANPYQALGLAKEDLPWLFYSPEEVETWTSDCREYVKGDYSELESVWFHKVAVPLAKAWNEWKANNISGAIRLASEIESPDWQLACTAWLLRAAEARWYSTHA